MRGVSMTEGLQPFLHEAIVALKAPAQVWSGQDGRFAAPIDGVYVSDVRVARDLDFTLGGVGRRARRDDDRRRRRPCDS